MKLEEYDYAGATGIAAIMLAISFLMLLAINFIQSWSRRRSRRCLRPRSPPRSLAAPRAASPTKPPWARWLLIGVAIAFLGLFLLLPLAVVFSEAFAKGVGAYFETFADADARAAIWLTLIVAAIAVPMNVVFGIVAAWAIAKFDFVGKNVLITLIDLPFSVSPVVSGLIFVLVFGAQGVIGPWVAAHGDPDHFRHARASSWRRCSSRFPLSRGN